MDADGTLTLVAPLTGYLLPLEKVPDPVFAGKMVGDGVSLDPVSQCLLAPCPGKVAQVHPAHHAVAVTHPSGVEVLIHIGLDTVALKGQGFKALVAVGDAVAEGDRLIEFDADFVATHARSLLTQIVITSGDRVAACEPLSGRVEAGRDPVLRLRLAEAAEAGAAATGPQVVSPPVKVPNPEGLHARPAAVLVSLARRFQSEVQVVKGEARANARSVVAVMSLEVDQGDTVTVEARGPDAEEAARVISQALAGGLGEEAAALASAAPRKAERPAEPEEPGVLRGVAASPGLAVGRVHQWRRAEIEVPEMGGPPQEERRRLDAALEEAKGQLDSLQQRLADPARAAIFAAHREVLEDPELTERASAAIQTGKSAAYGWRRAYTAQADRLASLKSELLAMRANDLRDVGERVLRLLVGEAAPKDPHVPMESILVAEDLTPSDTATLDRARVLGFCTVMGGATSHVAILARSLDLPALVAVDPRALDVPNGTPVVLDGSQGVLRVDPPEAQLQRLRERQQAQRARREELAARAHEPAVTPDGHRVEVAANIGSLEDAEKALALGAEGVGLLRSEFLFMGRATPPTEEEQAEVYRAVARLLGPERPLIVRTLDVGGDKPLAYLPIAHEENPFLGERGLRAFLARPELLKGQLRAIMRAASEAKLGVMLPMVTTLTELRQARAIFEEERRALGSPAVQFGIMVEVPAAALMADRFAPEVDFFSLGTNDLTQYTLAMDRGHPKLAPQVDGLNPAVLRLVDATVRAAHRHGKWVGLCGGLAGEDPAVPILVGLGVDELSVAGPAVPTVKAAVRARSLGECRDLARQALDLGTAAEVRELMEVTE